MIARIKNDIFKPKAYTIDLTMSEPLNVAQALADED